ncbi:hypothetical protein VP01_663g14 [Puccinia sorghi]|uniref:CxC1-like cysteine cluster associated with KDZ transposases domain-containing protein n=1 Tax=Puccinia sorghi TaxID=27349 RepID=A0A0L6UFW7_9BASI|nr:hypothetical protein VP01_663g14 [Puccinia sorghi]
MSSAAATALPIKAPHCISNLLLTQHLALENMTDELIFSVLRLGPQDILALQSCPACFGLRPPNLSNYPGDHLMLCFDESKSCQGYTYCARKLNWPHRQS